MEDKRKRLSFSYEDTDQKLEIELYGLVFEIKELDSVEKLESMDRDNQNVIEAQLEKILGNGAIDKINRKRVKDGYKELNLDIELSIFGCILEAYAKGQSDKVIGRAVKAVSDINKEMNNINNMNREQRRNYNRNRGYNRYRRY